MDFIPLQAKFNTQGGVEGPSSAPGSRSQSMGGTEPAGSGTASGTVGSTARASGVAKGAPMAAGGVTAAGVTSVEYGERSSAMPPGSEHTGVCGTSFYISPEISNGWASYDAKV